MTFFLPARRQQRPAVAVSTALDKDMQEAATTFLPCDGFVVVSLVPFVYLATEVLKENIFNLPLN